MDALRIILIVIGALVLGGIYLWGRRRERPRTPREEVPPSADLDWEEGAFPAERIPGLDSEGLERLAGLRVDNDPISESAARESVAPSPAEPPAKKASTKKTSGTADAAKTEPVRDKLKAPAKVLKEAVRTVVPDSAADRHKPSGAQKAPAVPREMLVVLNVLAPQGRAFTGSGVLEAMAAAGLRHGAMDIFHYPVGEGETLFSVANLLEPGRFDPDRMDDFTTPGLAMFMRLPGPLDGLEAVDRMIEAGHTLAGTLGGELCDETRSVLSAQTETHLRDRIKEYQRQVKLARIER